MASRLKLDGMRGTLNRIGGRRQPELSLRSHPTLPNQAPIFSIFGLMLRSSNGLNADVHKSVAQICILTPLIAAPLPFDPPLNR